LQAVRRTAIKLSSGSHENVNGALQHAAGKEDSDEQDHEKGQ
jgi:hypothetical protein